MRSVLLVVVTFFLILGTTFAQEGDVRTNVYVIYDGDTIAVRHLPPVHVFAPKKFASRKERIEYTRLVRDVRVAYPYAQMVASSVIETYEYMETLPNDKARQKHLEQVEKYMMDTYKPKLKKMTKRQGQILMKLIDRECNTSSYNIVKALLGNFQAGVYNVFAGMFGNSLKVKYDPMGKDREIEDIVIQINEGTVDYYYSQGTIL